MSSVRSIAGAVALVCAVAGCSSDDDGGPSGPNQPSGPTVAATASNVFTPNSLDVAIGEAVTWVFGAVDHNVLFNPVAGAPQDIGITRNANVSRTFSTAGSFPYACTLHPGMNGTVRVNQSSGNPIGY